MTDRVLRNLRESSGCEVRGDNLIRQLYATDASIYQIEPLGVAFPRGPAQAASLIRCAADEGIPLIPRGGGSGLVGGAIGEGLIVEFSRDNRQITDLDVDRRTVRVGPGVVLDQLNAFLQNHGLCFGPDVATSSRATLGGMIANNSSGSHVPVHGTTADHVASLDIALSDGRIVTLDADSSAWPEGRTPVDALVRGCANEIRERMPDGLQKRWPGYGVDRWLRRPGHLADIMAGSEGTLAAIVSAELKLVPRPTRKGLGLIFFASVGEAMQATVELLDLRPAAIEHIDRVLFDQTKGQIQFKAARDLLRLDDEPCESILLVEFYDDTEDRLAALERRRLGLRRMTLRADEEMNLVWGMRKAGLTLLTGRPGAAKPATGIEDAAVPPRHLPDYVQGLSRLLAELDLEACFYGHAASGLLHVRPVLDLHRADDLRKLRRLGDEVSAMVRQFKGSLAGEHGVGVARTEYMAEQLGPTVLQAMRDIKGIFDPKNLFNPGKIFDRGLFQIDTRLRWGAGYEVDPPFAPRLIFPRKQESFAGNLEQCNGCGGCRKDAPMMCPTFIATGDEIMSTRGRANAIRAALDGRRTGEGNWWDAPEITEALRYCLACKGCTAECPSNVNLTMLKSELLHARHQKTGLSWTERLVGAVDRLGPMGCAMPWLANAPMRWSWSRKLMERWLGFAAARPLPAYAKERFDHWFERRPGPARRPTRGPVILWDDTFVRYHEPHIGRAAVAVLEAAGFEVTLLRGRQCCGRPAFSQGWLDRAAGLGRANLELLRAADCPAPIVFLESSCWSMFAEDYQSLQLPGAAEVAPRAQLFEAFIEELLDREPEALPLRSLGRPVVIHAHCHAKSLCDPTYMKRLAERVAGAKVSLLKTGCCGMAGAFGAMQTTYELSCQVARPLVDLIEQQPADSVVVASGTSCRHQIEHLTSVRPRHMAEWIWEAMRDESGEKG